MRAAASGRGSRIDLGLLAYWVTVSEVTQPVMYAPERLPFLAVTGRLI
jgi:hypothetical protein